jgi:glycine cleavage system H lipoate-binding protein
LIQQVRGFEMPVDPYYHCGHTWARIEGGGNIRIGLDDFAHRLLGPFSEIKTPLIGKTVGRDRAALTIARGDKSAQVLSPVDGVVTAVNPDLQKDRDVISQHPYTNGWMLQLHTVNLRQDLAQFMMGQKSADFFNDEIQDLYELIEDAAGPLAADGGFLDSDIYGRLPQMGWKRLTDRFLTSR